jgi:hypothetical protein
MVNLHLQWRIFADHRFAGILSPIGAIKAPNPENRITFHRTLILDLSPTRSTHRPLFY